MMTRRSCRASVLLSGWLRMLCIQWIAITVSGVGVQEARAGSWSVAIMPVTRAHAASSVVLYDCVIENDTGGELSLDFGVGIVAESPDSIVSVGFSSRLPTHIGADGYFGPLLVVQCLTSDPRPDRFRGRIYARAKGTHSNSVWSVAIGDSANAGAEDAAGGAKLREAGILNIVSNPARSRVAMEFVVPVGKSGDVSIFDCTGHRVAQLKESAWGEGLHKIIWDGVGVRGERVASGVYVARLRVGMQMTVRRIVFLR